MGDSYPQLQRRKGESPGDRANRLQAEAVQAAAEQLALVRGTLRALAELSATVSEGGPAYPAGARELCRRLVEEAESRLATLEQIVNRTGVGVKEPIRLAK